MALNLTISGRYNGGNTLEQMVFLQDCYLLNFDGTGYFSFFKKIRQDYPRMKGIINEDALRFKAPHIDDFE